MHRRRYRQGGPVRGARENVMPHPPAIAEALIGTLVADDRRDSILGDLLEEYRDTQVARRGESGADWWYMRQAAGFLWRAAAPWAAVFGLTMASRELIDATVISTDNYHVRAAATTYLALLIYASAGLFTGWRSRRVASGFVVSLVMTAAATAATVVAVLGLSALQSAGARYIIASYSLREGLDIPVPVMLVLGGAFATIGAAIGKAGRRVPRVDVT